MYGTSDRYYRATETEVGKAALEPRTYWLKIGCLTIHITAPFCGVI